MSDSPVPVIPEAASLTLDPLADWLPNAHSLARFAYAAYHGHPAGTIPGFEDRFNQYVPFRGERVRGSVIADETDVIVTFRGVKEDREWVEALTYSQMPWVRGRAHRGLVKVLNSVWEPLLAALYDTDAIEKRLWLTGHSLGGAMVVLATLRLENDGYAPQFACTFGTPRVVDPEAANSICTPMYRFVNNEDPIPDLPWPSLTETYAHAGKRVFLLASGAIAEDRHSPHLARKIDRAFSIGEGILPAGMVHDHSMTNYLAKIHRLARESTDSA